MLDYNAVKTKAARLRALSGGNIRAAIDILDLTLLELSLGTEPDSIRAFILKNSRCATIVLNADLADDAVPFILAHEAGHYVMNHLKGNACAMQDREFTWRAGNTDLARRENEATFFAAEFLLDTAETLSLLHEYDLLTAASMLKVPPEFLEFKARLMARDGLIADYQDPLPVRSDFLRRTPLCPGP